MFFSSTVVLYSFFLVYQFVIISLLQGQVKMKEIELNLVISNQGTTEDLVISNQGTTEDLVISNQGTAEASVELGPTVEVSPEHEVTSPVKPPVIVQLMMVMFGLFCLLGYNFFINNTVYFKLKFDKSDGLKENFLFYFNFGAMPTTIVCGLSSMLLIKLVRLEVIIWVSYVNILLSYIIATTFTMIDTEGWEVAFFVISIMCLMTMIAGGVCATTALIALCSMMNKELVGRYFLGKGFSGLVAVLINILFTVMLDTGGKDGVKAGQACFGSGIFMSVCILFLFFMFTRNSYVISFLKKSRNLIVKNDDLDEGEKKANVKELFPKAAKLFFVTFFTNFLGMSVHPAMMAKLKSTNHFVEDQYFLLVFLFLIFSVGDLCGKTSSQLIKFPSKDTIVYFAVGRVVLAVMCLMCNLQPRPIPVWFKADYWPAILVFLFSFSHGQIVCLSYIYAPSVVDNAVDKAVVGTIHHIGTFVGLILGTVVSFLLQFLSQL